MVSIIREASVPLSSRYFSGTEAWKTFDDNGLIVKEQFGGYFRLDATIGVEGINGDEAGEDCSVEDDDNSVEGERSGGVLGVST